MTPEQINHIAMNAARKQRIDADDRALQLAVDLEIANRKIEELQKQLEEKSNTP